MHPDLKELFSSKGVSINPHRFAVYLPSKLSDETPIDPARFKVLCDMATEFLCRELGGMTSYQAEGVWIDDEKRVHREEIRVAESYCEEGRLIENGGKIRTFVNALAIEFEQSSMACVVDGEMVFLVPTDEYRKTHYWIASLPADKLDTSTVQGFVLDYLESKGIPSVASRK